MEPDFIYIQPKDENTTVPNPATNQNLRFNEPYRITRTQYWNRRIKDGSVVIVPEPVINTETSINTQED